MSIISFFKKKDNIENSLIGEFLPENFNIRINGKKLELFEVINSYSIEEITNKRNNFLEYINNVNDSKRLLIFFINDLYLLSQKIEITDDLLIFLYFIQGWQELLAKNDYRCVYIIDNDIDTSRVINSKMLFDKFKISFISLEVNRGKAKFIVSDDLAISQFSSYQECEEKYGKYFDNERRDMKDDYRAAIQNNKNIVCASKFFIKSDLEFFYNELKNKEQYIGIFRVNAPLPNTLIKCFKDGNNQANIFKDMK